MTTEVEFHKINDEMIAKAREEIGKTHYRNPKATRWNTTASLDNIRQWCYGIGDTNRLWQDPQYARKTRYGGIIAPPSFISSCGGGPLWHLDMQGSRGRGMPGLHALVTGGGAEYFDIIRQDDIVIPGASRTTDIVEKRSSYTGRMFMVFNEGEWYTQRGLVAKSKGHSVRYERGTPTKYGKYDNDKAWKYTREELEKIARDYDSEIIRGATPRYWEEVQVGEDMGHMVKGPCTVTSMITFLMGWGSPFCITDKMAHEYLKAHPAAGIPDPDSGVMDFPERAHWDPWFAKQIGFPSGGYDIIAQRLAWSVNFFTNWMGDDGFLKKYSIELRRPNWLNDTTWFGGKVVKKYTSEDEEHLVDCEIWADNQRGQRHTIGSGTVRLPTKDDPEIPARRRR